METIQDLKPIGTSLSEKNNFYYTGIDEDNDTNNFQGYPNASRSVNWEVQSGKRTVYINCDIDIINNCHIEKYCLNENGRLWYKYRLSIIVNTPGTYYFTDESGDKYKLGVTNKYKPHYVDYNSPQPNIKLVEFVDY